MFARVLDDAGQAAAEFVALLPVLVVLCAGVGEALLGAHAWWAAQAAARAAARAAAVGGDPQAAARAHLERGLERGLTVRASAGRARVTVAVPQLPGLPRLGHVSAESEFAPQ